MGDDGAAVGPAVGDRDVQEVLQAAGLRQGAHSWLNQGVAYQVEGHLPAFVQHQRLVGDGENLGDGVRHIGHRYG